MEIQKDAPPVRENTDVGRLLRAYVATYPRKVGGYEESREYTFKFHTQSQRSGDLTKRGYPTVGVQRVGEDFHEFRFKDYPTFVRAWRLVQSWRLGIPVEQIEDLHLTPPVFVAEVGGGQVGLDLSGVSCTSPHSVVTEDGHLV